ncbi:MAG: NADH-quinone oxidoreductase subunit NuoE [Phycisphaerae bacterium]|nr:NADH-quinone oxidoreductase subunit NuoE [Phycisphaerae bacterium]
MLTKDDPKLDQLKQTIDQVMQKPYSDSYLIAVLHKTQALYGYLPEDIINIISVDMNIPTAHIWGVATFYHYFNLTPQGQHRIAICLGTACYVKGAAQIVETLKQQLKIDMGQTTADGLFTLRPARCLGACGLAPVVMIDDTIHGELTPKKMSDIVNKHRRQAKKK